MMSEQLTKCPHIYIDPITKAINIYKGPNTGTSHRSRKVPYLAFKPVIPVKPLRSNKLMRLDSASRKRRVAPSNAPGVITINTRSTSKVTINRVAYPAVC